MNSKTMPLAQKLSFRDINKTEQKLMPVQEPSKLLSYLANSYCKLIILQHQRSKKSLKERVMLEMILKKHE